MGTTISDRSHFTAFNRSILPVPGYCYCDRFHSLISGLASVYQKNLPRFIRSDLLQPGFQNVRLIFLQELLLSELSWRTKHLSDNRMDCIATFLR